MTSSLDSIGIEMLKFVNEIDKQKKKLEETLLEGRFNLSKSRIIIGKERLSSTSYPVESSASFKVDIKNENETLKFEPFGSQLSSEKISKNDPIFSFGILLPGNLYEAKKYFIEAAKISCQICELESKLDSYKQTYRDLTTNNDVIKA